MYSLRATLLLPAFFLSIAVHAQISCTLTLGGKIVDDYGNPLVGAAIRLDGREAGQTTDAEGEFVFENLCPGAYTVTIQYVGYETLSVVLDVDRDMRRTFALSEHVRELDEVVVHHHDAANTEHATNFVTLGERDLAEAAGKTLGEMLRDVPGVTVLQTGPGIFKPVVHGLYGQRLLILNHGIRQEGQQWGAEHAPEIDPFVASNVVVIKDASAIKYGSDAMGGVIVVNPAPLPETDQLGGTLTSVFQSNGRSGTLSGMLEGGIKNAAGWGWRVQATAKRAGDSRAPAYTLTNTGVKELNFSAATGYHVKKMGFDLFFSRFQSEIGILKGSAVGNPDDLAAAMEREVPLYTAGFSYKIGEPRQEVTHDLLKVNGHISGESGEWRFQYGFQNDNRKEFDLRKGSLSSIPAIDLQLRTHTFDAEWETHHSESRTLSYGFNTMFQSNRNIPGSQRIPFIPNFGNFTGGVFATSKFFFHRWTVDGGVRADYRKYSVKGYDYLNTYYSASFDFLSASASLGISRDVGTGQTVGLNVSSSWRPPHVSELYSMGTHQSAAAIEYGLVLDPVSNEVRDFDAVSFSPEQALKAVSSYELTHDRFQLRITPYINYILNYIFLRPYGVTQSIRGVYPYFRYHQTDAMFIGADFDATLRLHRNLSVTPKAALLKAKDVVNDSYFLFIPSNRYSLSARYERHGVFGFANAYLESSVRAVAKQRFAPRVITVREIAEAGETGGDIGATTFDFKEAPGGYTLWSMAAGFTIRSKKVQYDIRIAGENLLNERYRDYTNRMRYYADEPGSNLSISIECIF